MKLTAPTPAELVEAKERVNGMASASSPVHLQVRGDGGCDGSAVGCPGARRQCTPSALGTTAGAR